MVEPPTYTQQDASEQQTEGTPEIQIVPSSDALNFQKGFLGAEDEHAAIEGEIQIKGAIAREWSELTISLRSIECSFDHEIELGCSEMSLFSGPGSWPSPFSFSIPLMPDTPQSMQTHHSALYHTLTAVLHPIDKLKPPLTKSVQVYTRRYTSHIHTIPLSPRTISHDDPTRMEIQIPRTNFKANEPIPLYVTIPPPRTELVVEEGVRLRNVRAELVRVVEVSTNADQDLHPTEGSETGNPPSDGDVVHSPNGTDKPRHSVTTTSSASSALLLGSSYRSVVSRSGASCRFHAARPVRLRFLLNPPSSSSSTGTREYGSTSSDVDSPPITQTTLLHSISFHVNVLISFVDIASHTERITTVRIPVDILPPSAPLPEIAPSLDAAYIKKHDRPPSRTIRIDNADSSVPQYSDSQAGPSAQSSDTPPPFEERDAPPPFFSTGEGSQLAGPPSFLESEQQIIDASDNSQGEIQQNISSPEIIGEGTEFGFPYSAQFDGHTEDMQRPSTPPPSLEMAARDTDLTALTDIRQTERVMERLGMVLEQHEEDNHQGDFPPPPPPMDDPSDPPPVIDFHYSSDAGQRTSAQEINTVPQIAEPFELVENTRPTSLETQPNLVHDTEHRRMNAPPPYLGDQSGTQEERDRVSGPPPYVG